MSSINLAYVELGICRVWRPTRECFGSNSFAVYVNDLPRQLSNVSKLYADDLKIIAKVDSKENVLGLQSDLDKVSEWCRYWHMNPNTLAETKKLAALDRTRYSTRRVIV